MIKIQISNKRIKVGDLRKAQADDIDATLRLIAGCMVGPDGEYLPREDALAQLDELDLETLEEEVINPFMAALEVQKNISGKPSERRQALIAIESGGSLPLFAEILEAAKEWGCPPWEVESGPIEWFWKWEFYRSKVNAKEAREAEEWRHKK